MLELDNSSPATVRSNLDLAPTTPDVADAGKGIETTIAQIWASVLGLDQVDPQENFLLLGGESLMATQVASQVLSQLKVEVPIRSILVGTVAEVAEEVAAKLAIGR